MLTLVLAWKFLREGRAQSLLILGGVSIGVAAYVFVATLIASLQTDMIRRTLGAQAHIVVAPLEERARPLMADVDLRHQAMGTSVPPRFLAWEPMARRLANTPGVVAVSSVVDGPALANRGQSNRAVLLIGVDLPRHAEVIDLRNRIISGRFAISGTDVLVGSRLAEDLGVDVGQPFRITTANGVAVVRVAGVFEFGNEGTDTRWIFLPLRAAQSLVGTRGEISHVEVRVSDPFEAEAIAESLRSNEPADVQSWMEKNRDLLVALRSQDQSNLMIRVFVMLAVAMGIASVLVVTVVQRRGQIGILRAIGMSRSGILQVFLWQGAMFGGLGGAIGIGIGIGVTKLLGRVTIFPIVLEWQPLSVAGLVAIGTALVAAYFPSRSASRLDPARAIRGEG